MPAERVNGPRRWLAFRGSTFGEVAMAAFLLCALSGVLLVPAYDAREGSRSIAEWLLTNPGAVWLRNAHYWTAQVFLVGTGLHIWDHLRGATERRVAPGIWLRLVASLPVVAFLMLSGFLLRGDSDAQQARRILEEVLRQLPRAGPALATFLFGAGEQLQVIYLHHAATATIVVGLVVIEHARRLWPRRGTTTGVAVLVAVTALVLSPGLHDGLDPRLKGPWYFLGLQEALHWMAGPRPAMLAGVIALAALWVLPRVSAGWATALKRGAVVAFGGYAALSVIGLFLRGTNWQWQRNWPAGPSDLHAGWILASAAPANAPVKLPTVLGRTEGCLVCHANVTGLGDAHRPDSIGCASCHGGNVYALNAGRAHAGLVRIPGNLTDAARTCGQTGCHETVVPRVERSIMTTFAGVIQVDRAVFGESVNRSAHVRDLGNSAADTHVRQLCASCHLGQSKESWGAITPESRGGGCNACHLVYSAAAAQQLASYEGTPLPARTEIPRVHPELSIKIESDHCFGCHSRSGRISTNYEGWSELHAPPAASAIRSDAARTPGTLRQLDDGRFFERMTPDVHQERGLGCIDCHTANEVMGKGNQVARKHEQEQVRCEDCHARLLTRVEGPLDAETQKLLRLRQVVLGPGERLGATRTADPMVNVIVSADGRGRLINKRTGAPAELRPPTAACAAGAGHDRLSCGACHTAWAPRCVSCHTSFDPTAEGFDHLKQAFGPGAWEEHSDGFGAAPPTLGVRNDPGDPAHPRGLIETFTPGMILQVDRNRTSGQPADLVFRRLYARTAPHTTRREARSCVSCHSDPIALGYGAGSLRYEVARGEGTWRFTPRLAVLAADGLPADAWVGFFRDRTGVVSTRDDVRPFTVDEQERILAVGACLTCHAGDSAVMTAAVQDFRAAVARRSRACVPPSWPGARR